MNRDDKNSLQAFKSMFGALSQSVKNNFERKALKEQAIKEIQGNEPPPLASVAVEQRGTNVVSLAGVTATKARSRSPQHP